jgi:hypothetical protein
MFTKILTSVVAVLLACYSGARAQPAAGDVQISGMAGTIVLSYVAHLMIATGMCTLGDREDWQKVVVATDKRYRFCAAKYPAWSGLLGDFKEDERKSLAAGQSRSFGSFYVEHFLNTRGYEARRQGMEAYCASAPWKMLLAPGAATPEAKAEYLKARPQADLEGNLKIVGLIRRLGVDPAWIEAPCDKEFWPAYIREDK